MNQKVKVLSKIDNFRNLTVSYDTIQHSYKEIRKPG